MSVTKGEIADWMIERIQSRGYLYQADAAQEIESKFGREWIYQNENGNPAIDPGVLREFRRRKSDRITWETAEKSWNYY